MKKYMIKTVLFGILTTLVFGSFAAASADSKSPEIESVDPWPQNLNHGEEIYVDAEITGQSSVESAWIVVSSNGERLRTGTLVDSNNDGYYVSPVAFTAEGGKTYDITVKASDAQGNEDSNTVSVAAECRFGIAQTCIY